MTEDELELFDLLAKEATTQDETQHVKRAARRLLERLVKEQPKVLVQDWFRDQQTQKVVRSVLARLNDAGNAALAPESRFDLAYNAAHACIVENDEGLGPAQAVVE